MSHHPPRVPRSIERERRAFLIVFTAILVLGALAIAIVGNARAESIPTDGPQLSGTITQDKSLVAFWTRDADGTAVFVKDGDTLRSDALEVITYAPLANTHNGTMYLTFVWERNETVTKQTVVNGTVETTRELVWNETDRQTYPVLAFANSLQNTELSLPSKHGDRLTVYYTPLGPGESEPAVGEDGQRLMRITHDTSYLYAKLPQQNVQGNYSSAIETVAIALVVALAGVWASKFAYKKSGGYVPPLDPGLTILGVLLGGGIVAYLAWTYYREELVVKGLIPPLIAFWLLVTVLSLQIWREPAPTWQFKRYHTGIEQSQPEVDIWSVSVPARAHDPHPLTDDPRDVQYVTDSWKDFAYRLIGARTYLSHPDERNWYYDVHNHTSIVREHILRDQLAGGMCQRCIAIGVLEPKRRPHLALEKDPTVWASWIPRLRFHKLARREMPLSPWGTDKEVLSVLQDLITMEACAEERTVLQVRVTQLEAEVRAGILEKTRKFFEEFLVREDAAIGGLTLEESRKRLFPVKAATMPKDEQQKGAPGTPERPGTPAPAAAAAAPTPSSGGTPP